MLKRGIYMGYKSIDMQIAIPRSQDASRIQNQLMRQGQQFQETLTEKEIKQAKLNQAKVNEYEEVQWNDTGENEQQGKRQREKKTLESEREKKFTELSHPYLGNHIDFPR